MKRILVTFALAAFFLCGSLSCDSTGPSDGDTASTGGSGSEIVGVVATPDSTAGSGKLFAPSMLGNPLAGAQIFFYSQSFIPAASMVGGAIPKTTTGADGSFRIQGIPRGKFILEATNRLGLALAKEIAIDRDTVVDVGTLLLQKTGSVQFRIVTNFPGEVSYYVSLKGTRVIVSGNQTGIDFRIDQIPTGVRHTLHMEVLKPIQSGFDVTTFELNPGAVLSLPSVELK